MALLFLCLIFGTGRTQKIEAADTETDQAAAAQDELLAELDFDAIQQDCLLYTSPESRFWSRKKKKVDFLRTFRYTKACYKNRNPARGRREKTRSEKQIKDG